MSWKDKIRAIREAAEDAFRWTMKRLGWDADDFDQMTDGVELLVKAWAVKNGVPPGVTDAALGAMFSHLDSYAAGLIAKGEK